LNRELKLAVYTLAVTKNQASMTSVEFSLEVNSLFSFEFDTVYGEITFFDRHKKIPPKKRVATHGLNEKAAGRLPARWR
jgi:hypothetical protein